MPFDRALFPLYNGHTICKDVITITPYHYQTAVQYPDVGADHRLNHHGLLRMLQEAGALASDVCGYGLKDISTKGLFWILMGWRLQFIERPMWNTPITVKTWPRTVEGFISDRDFAVFAEDKLIAKATSRWFLINTHTGRIARATEEVKNAYQLDPTAMFDEPLLTNGKTPEGIPAAFCATAGRRDIDTNNHVNNIHYLGYALEALPQEVFDNLPSTLEITFRKQILLGTTFRCHYSLTEDGKHQVEIQSGEGNDTVHHAFLWFYD